MTTVLEQVEQIEYQIAALKEQRDALLRDSGLEKQALVQILRIRSPKRTLCQMLRELYDAVDESQRETVGRCLSAAKKMDRKLVEYAGQGYAGDWYD